MYDLPAILGGPPVRPQGPPAWPPFDPDVLAALQSAHADGSWGKYHGGHVEKLEQELRNYHAVEHALTCGSGTFAVELALRALKIGPGDEVILAAYDFPGNFLSVHAVGAIPVLVDVDPENWNLDPQQLPETVTSQTKAIIVSHLHGGVVPIKEVMEIARTHTLAVIEDAAQMPGAFIQGKKAGTWGDVGILSFGGSKLLTAGRGGAVLTNNADVFQRARTYQLRGNLVCPLSELQAAVLVLQLGKLEQRNRLRSDRVGQLLRATLTGLRPFVNRTEQTSPGYYKLGFQFDKTSFGLTRERFVAAMRAEGIAFDEGFHAAHVGRSPKRFRQSGGLEEATKAHEGCVILHHPVLLGDETEVIQIVTALEKVRRHADLVRE